MLFNKKLFNYIAYKYIRIFFSVLTVISAVILIADLNNSASSSISNSLLTLLYHYPVILINILDFIIFISIMITIIKLNHSLDIIVIRSFGVSKIKILLSIINIIILQYLFILFILLPIASQAENKYNQLRNDTKNQQLLHYGKNGLWNKNISEKNLIFSAIKAYDNENKTLYDITALIFDKDYELLKIIKAKQGKFIAKNKIELIDGNIYYTYDYSSKPISKYILNVNFNQEYVDFKFLFNKKKFFSIPELIFLIKQNSLLGEETSKLKAELNSLICKIIFYITLVFLVAWLFILPPRSHQYFLRIVIVTVIMLTLFIFLNIIKGLSTTGIYNITLLIFGNHLLLFSIALYLFLGFKLNPISALNKILRIKN